MAVHSGDQFRAMNGALFSTDEPEVVTLSDTTAVTSNTLDNGVYLLYATAACTFRPYTASTGAATDNSNKLPKETYLPIRIQSNEYSSISFKVASGTGSVQIIEVK